MGVFLTDPNKINPSQKRRVKPNHPWNLPNANQPPKPMAQDHVANQVQHLVGSPGCYSTFTPYQE